MPASSLTVRPDGGFISTTRDGLALRLASTTVPRFGPRAEPGVVVDGRVLNFVSGDLDSIFGTRLGYEGRGTSWIASAWMKPAGATWYLLAVGGSGTDKIRVYLGEDSTVLDAPGGVVVPAKAVNAGALPPVVIASFGKDGVVVATMSNR